jgi:hypothetical protein
MRLRESVTGVSRKFLFARPDRFPSSHTYENLRTHVLAPVELLRMTTRNDEYHYLRTSLRRGESGKYSSESEAMTAMGDLIELQSGRGFKTKRDRTGKYLSKHPDGRSLQFWVESQGGSIVS